MTGEMCGRRSRAMSLVLAAASGLFFGAGLLVSGMTLPDRVLGFLDATAWDPSLGFVMGSAVVTYTLFSRMIFRQRPEPWFDGVFHLPTRRDVDLPLVSGAVLFGAGWGLAGSCPGPGLVAAASGNLGAIGFAVSMLAGMWLFHRSSRP